MVEINSRMVLLLSGLSVPFVCTKSKSHRRAGATLALILLFLKANKRFKQIFKKNKERKCVSFLF
jgi:hypothetical protein